MYVYVGVTIIKINIKQGWEKRWASESSPATQKDVMITCLLYNKIKTVHDKSQTKALIVYDFPTNT